MKLGIIIQARTGSSRLPKKMLLPFYKDKTILDILLRRIKEHIKNAPVVVATSSNKNDVEIVNIAQRNKVDFFCGDENDVLQRFINVADFFGFDSVIRVCADNPFLSMEKLKVLIEFSSKNTADYISFQKNDGTPSIKTHFGFWTEFVTLSALKTINEKTKDPLYHEHVTNFAYSNPQIFSLKFLPIEDFIEQSDVRLTVDTYEDFKLSALIYKKLVEKNLSVEPKNIIPLITDDMKQTMKSQIIANLK